MRRDLCRPAAGGATEVKITLGPGLPIPHRRTFAAALQGLSLTRKSAALRHPWLRWPPTPAPGARAAPPRTSIRKGDGGGGIGELFVSTEQLRSSDETSAVPQPVMHARRR